MSTQPQNGSRMALLYLVASELNASLNLDQTLRRVLIATVRIAGATDGSFFVFDKEEALTHSLFVSGSKVHQVDSPVADLMLTDGVIGWVKQHKETVLVQNAADETRWDADKNNPKLKTHHSLISVPLLIEDTLLGVLTLTHKKANYFDTGDLTILIAVAEQAATAIIKARLYQTEQQQHALSNTLADSFRQMNTTHDLKKLFKLILDQLALLIPYDQCNIFLREKGLLTIAASRGLKNIAEAKQFPVELYEDDFAHPLIDRHQPLVTPDLQQKDTWFKNVTDISSRSWIGLPLVSGGSLTGIITIAKYHPGSYDEQDIQVIQSFAGQAAVAIKNARLLTQLRDTQKRYTQLFEESSDLLLIIDPDGFILDANRKASQIFRRPKDVLIDSQLALLGTELRDFFTQQRQNLGPGKEQTTELGIRDAYGQPITLEISAKQVEIDGKIAIQWAGRDVTARYELIALRQDLTNMIVHDLRGPMGTMMGSIQMLSLILQGIPDPELVEEVNGLINIANRSGQYLKDLIDSVLDLGRLEQGNAPLAVSPTPLVDIFTEVREQTSPQATAKKININFSGMNDALIVNLDRNMIRRVLVNLIDNAIKYTPTGGKIRVETTVDEQAVTVQVIDNGPGIPSESQTHLFEKFTRATTDATIHGVGLGLAFCKLAIDAHQGQIWLESEVDVGSRFIFSIPRNLQSK